MRLFLPQDTRIVDIISGLAMLALAVELMVLPNSTETLLEFRPLGFWVVVFIVISILQITSLQIYPSAETLRAISCGLSGIFWVYFSLGHIGSGILIVPLIYLFGLSCLYSSCLTVLLISKRWKQ